MSYARVIFAEYEPETIQAMQRKAEEMLVPRFRQIPGFSAYQLAQVSDRLVISFATFDTLEGAKEAERLGNEWLNQVATDTLVSSKTYVGEITFAAGRRAHEEQPSL